MKKKKNMKTTFFEYGKLVLIEAKFQDMNPFRNVNRSRNGMVLHGNSVSDIEEGTD